jgi:hypothetical protein
MIPARYEEAVYYNHYKYYNLIIKSAPFVYAEVPTYIIIHGECENLALCQNILTW